MQARGYGGGEGGGRKHEHQFHARQVYIGWVGVRLVLWMVVWAVMCVCVIMEWVHNGRYPSIESASITGLQVLTNERQVLTNVRQALTNEPQALTNERQALTNERQVLTNKHHNIQSQQNRKLAPGAPGFFYARPRGGCDSVDTSLYFDFSPRCILTRLSGRVTI